MNLTERLKAAIWQCYGNPSYPAEWDGTVYGGGKLSQRYWEYHQTIELLELTSDSVVLDIGGGSPITGAGFFTRVIAPYVKEVHVMDVNIGESKEMSSKIKFHHTLASYDTLSKLLRENRQITHVACISVFEHIPHEVRCGMVKALNETFTGNTFVATLEYHAKQLLFDKQLTARTLSELFTPLTNFYPDAIFKTPFWCEQAYLSPSIGQRILRRFGICPKRWTSKRLPETPLWYPVALRFRRVTE
jgi:hypothetical protein